MTVKIYSNYGVLGHEFQTVYTFGNPHPQAVSFDQITVDIPDKHQPYVTMFYGIALKLSGVTYNLNEALSSIDDEPCIRWFDESGCYHIERLPIIEG